MIDTAQTEAKIRMLVNAQTVDDQWFSEAAAVLGINKNIIQREQWNKAVWNSKYGEIVYSTVPAINGSYWRRPDGAKDIFIQESIGDPARIVKYALLGELIDILRNTSRLSYATVGYPEDVYNYKVFIDGQETSMVTEADALLGRVERHKRDSKGKMVRRGDELVSEQIFGKVEIVRQEERQAFF